MVVGKLLFKFPKDSFSIYLKIFIQYAQNFDAVCVLELWNLTLNKVLVVFCECIIVLWIECFLDGQKDQSPYQGKWQYFCTLEHSLNSIVILTVLRKKVEIKGPKGSNSAWKFCNFIKIEKNRSFRNWIKVTEWYCAMISLAVSLNFGNLYSILLLNICTVL